MTFRAPNTNQPLKIAFLSHLDLNLYLFRLPIMLELKKKGLEVFAIVPKGIYFNKFRELGIMAIDYKIKRESLNMLNEIKTIKNIRRIIKDLNPDILHTFMHKPNIYGNLSGAKNIVNTITGLGSFFINKGVKPKSVKMIIENLYRFTSKNAKRVVFQNSDDLNYFVLKGIIPKKKTTLIKGSGINTHEFRPIPKNKVLIKNLNIDEKPVVLMVARVIKDKGVQEYIKAAEILKDRANFLYAGDIDRGNKNSFMPDWKNVKYLGFRTDMKELISICDVFVLPSYREGIPRTLLEAASMAKPIVTTNSVGCREIVQDGKNGFLVPIKDHISLAKKINTLINNVELRKQFGISGREKVLKEFDIKIIVNEYIKVYEEII